MGKKVEKTFMESAAENARGFGLFIYNGEDGTVLGRTGRGWARISIFYLFYYLFLAALFALSINITLSCLDKDVPYFQTRVQVPGLTLQPKLPSAKSLSTDIIYTQSDASTYNDLVTHLDKFLAAYDKTVLGDCGNAGYGYAEGNPCIFLKVNKIIKWQPYPFIDLNEEEAVANEANREAESKAPALQDFIAGQGLIYDTSLMYVSCYAVKEEGKDKLTVSLPGTVKGLSIAGYPYEDATHKETYVPPIVAIQLSDVTRGEEILVGCKAYARNILDDTRTNAGFMHFKLKIDE